MEEELEATTGTYKICIEEFLQKKCQRVGHIKDGANWTDFIKELAFWLHVTPAQARTHAGESGLKEQRAKKSRVATDKVGAWALL